MALLCGAALSFQAIAPSTRRSTQLRESFGFDFAENTYSNQPNLLKGEQEYKQFVNKYKEDNMLNRKVREDKVYGSALVDHRDLTVFSVVLCHPPYHSPPLQYNVIGRVRELNLLKATADSGVLSKLEANGVDLATIEELLPLAEDLGLLSLAGSNQQLLVNLVAPLLIEPAPFLIPLIAGALEVGPSAFFAAAAGLAGLEFVLLANDVELPFVGLSAGVFLGLLLVPLTAVLTAAGVALANAKK